MKKNEFSILSSDGKTPLHVILWEPEDPPCCVIQLVHGMAEYIDRYHDFAAYLATKGYAVIGHDHLGHGKSITKEEDLGFFVAKSEKPAVIEDMHRIFEEAGKRFPGLPHFILGHSMGSFMVRYYLTKYSAGLSGAVIMGTGFIPAPLAHFGKFLSGHLAKTKGDHYRSRFLTNLTLGSNNRKFAPNRTEVDWLSRNTDNVDRYAADPLCGFPFTTGAYYYFFTVMEAIGRQENFDRIPKSLPLLIISGEEDPVGGKAACQKVKAVYDGIGMTDVTLKLYPRDRHEILNEVDRETVYKDLYDWFEEKK